MNNETAIAELNQIYGFLSPDKQMALDVAIRAIQAWDEVSKCLVFHGLDKRTPDTELSSFEAFVLEQLAEVENGEGRTMIDYKKAFEIACELLNDSWLYGWDRDKIFEKMMEKDGVVSSRSYERFILENLDYLTNGG